MRTGTPRSLSSQTCQISMSIRTPDARPVPTTGNPTITRRSSPSTTWAGPARASGNVSRRALKNLTTSARPRSGRASGQVGARLYSTSSSSAWYARSISPSFHACWAVSRTLCTARANSRSVALTAAALEANCHTGRRLWPGCAPARLDVARIAAGERPPCRKTKGTSTAPAGRTRALPAASGLSPRTTREHRGAFARDRLRRSTRIARQHLCLAVGSLAENRYHDVRVDLVGRAEGDGPRVPAFALHRSLRIGQQRPLVNHQPRSGARR